MRAKAAPFEPRGAAPRRLRTVSTKPASNPTRPAVGPTRQIVKRHPTRQFRLRSTTKRPHVSPQVTNLCETANNNWCSAALLAVWSWILAFGCLGGNNRARTSQRAPGGLEETVPCVSNVTPIARGGNNFRVAERCKTEANRRWSVQVAHARSPAALGLGVGFRAPRPLVADPSHAGCGRPPPAPRSTCSAPPSLRTLSITAAVPPIPTGRRYGAGHYEETPRRRTSLRNR